MNEARWSAVKDLLRSAWSPIGWVGIADLWGVRLTWGRWSATNSVVIVTIWICANTDTHACMPWVLGDECGTVVRGLSSVTGYRLRLRFLLLFLCSLLVMVSFSVSVVFSSCVLSAVVWCWLCLTHCTFPFGYVFCPRHAGIMLLEGGLTGNSYGLQRMSRLRWPGAFN